jgi:hypothetical protein
MWPILRAWHFRERGNGFHPKAKDTMRSRDVFELLLAVVLEGKLKPTSQVLVNPTRNTDSARLAQDLKPGRHIDTVTEDVFVLNDDVALVHPDPELDPLVHRQFSIALGHSSLDSHRAAHSLHSAWVLDENPISGRLDDAPVILGDVGIDHFTSNGFNSTKRSPLILAHQPAVADHVCHQDSREPALQMRVIHSRTPLSTRQGRPCSLPRGVP